MMTVLTKLIIARNHICLSKILLVQELSGEPSYSLVDGHLLAGIGSSIL